MRGGRRGGRGRGGRRRLHRRIADRVLNRLGGIVHRIAGRLGGAVERFARGLGGIVDRLAGILAHLFGRAGLRRGGGRRGGGRGGRRRSRGGRGRGGGRLLLGRTFLLAVVTGGKAAGKQKRESNGRNLHDSPHRLVRLFDVDMGNNPARANLILGRFVQFTDRLAPNSSAHCFSCLISRHEPGQCQRGDGLP
ncbi:hypothetical protein DKG74_11555 [Zavarzinia aquatilis]|uniref:Uncharacterized protein n=1 Tax=Zavarzinia aquatilis TaxID=2211142 RepID=A0A317E5W9_9PROT|nr:hypothetical protein DKG74_11555 [Zavarzinia aquatilis]